MTPPPVQADKTTTLGIRLAKREVTLLRVAAMRAGLRLTEWVRRELFRAAGLPADSVKRKPGWPKGRRRLPEASQTVQDGPGGESGPNHVQPRPIAS